MKANSGRSSFGHNFSEGLLQTNSIFSIFTIFAIYSKYMQIIAKPTSLIQLWDSREIDFVEMMKIVVDIRLQILAIDGDMHADLEKLLLDHGSHQQDLWGANVYPLKEKTDLLEFTSFINIRPSQGNRSMEVRDAGVKKIMQAVVDTLLL
jgi:hypothetical protein